ncbi:MAG: hypothetical protein G01um101425_821 [Candidatus Peregrinibacteria bacterium Gr01-1014_25]|nr:MAG: hypothetical protein G01um101425_821 [Candidatus Peregrinibacteria bacterium Gr01-1014_25]
MHPDLDTRFEEFTDEYEEAYNADGRPPHSVIGVLLHAALTPEDRHDDEDRCFAKKHPKLLTFMRASLERNDPLNWFCGRGFQELQVLDGMERLVPILGTLEDQEFALRQLFGGHVNPANVHIVPPTPPQAGHP